MKTFQIFFYLFSTLFFGQSKINGISFVASNTELNNSYIEPVIKINANWVTLMPFGFMKTISDTSIIYDSNRQWWGERKIGIKKSTELFHKKNIKIMLKPQIWIPNGFTGHIKMKSETDWLALENNYSKFILDYAKLAEEEHIEIFCIGTELNSFVTNRPIFWKNLIVKIREIYSGKITYAENWDTYKNVTFYKDIDYVGIDAYFPLSKSQTPTINELVKAWKPIKKEIQSLGKKFQKQIIFTEYGYQSRDFSAKEPWDFNFKTNVNLEAQNNALAVILASFWKEKWFAGGFLWKWYDNYNNSGGLLDTDFTVQNKPSEKIINRFYKN